MNGKYLLIPLALGWLLLSSPAVMADTAMQEMVGIMLRLHHYPDDADMVTLKKIINDSATSEDDRTIAAALTRMHHTVTDDDKAKLLDISHNEAAPAADREVAEILANMHHKASADARAELEKLK